MPIYVTFTLDVRAQNQEGDIELTVFVQVPQGKLEELPSGGSDGLTPSFNIFDEEAGLKYETREVLIVGQFAWREHLEPHEVRRLPATHRKIQAQTYPEARRYLVPFVLESDVCPVEGHFTAPFRYNGAWYEF